MGIDLKVLLGDEAVKDGEVNDLGFSVVQGLSFLRRAQGINAGMQH